MNFTKKLYRKTRRRMMFRVRVGVWLLQKNWGNNEWLNDYYIPHHLTTARLVANRYRREH